MLTQAEALQTFRGRFAGPLVSSPPLPHPAQGAETGPDTATKRAEPVSRGVDRSASDYPRGRRLALVLFAYACPGSFCWAGGLGFAQIGVAWQLIALWIAGLAIVGGLFGWLLYVALCGRAGRRQIQFYDERVRLYREMSRQREIAARRRARQ